MAGFRIRLYLARNVLRLKDSDFSEGAYWYYIDRTKVSNVAQLLHDIAKCLRLNLKHEYRLTLDGLHLLPSSPIDVLEKDDTVKIKLLKKGIESGESAPVAAHVLAKSGNEAEEQEQEQEPDALESPSAKKKKRNRKKKQTVREIRTTMSQCLSQLRTDSSLTEPPRPPPVNTSQLPTIELDRSNGPTKRKHIRFDEETGATVEVLSKPSTYPVLTRQFCNMEKQKNVSTVYRISNNSNGKQKKNDEFTSSGSDSTSSSDSEEAANGEQMDAEQNGISSPPHFGDPWREFSLQWSSNAQQKEPQQNGSQEKKSGSLVAVTSTSDAATQQAATFPPKVGSSVTFKMLELSEKFSPEISHNKIALVKSVDQETGLVTLEMMVGTIAVPGEDGTHEAQKMATVSWSSLIDPRLVN